MPTPKLEDALYNRAVEKGVRFTREQLSSMGHVGYPFDDGIEMDSTQTPTAPGWTEKENANAFLKILGAIAAVFLGVFYILIKVIIELTKPYSGGKHYTSSQHRSGRSPRKNNNHLCDGDCDHCPAHYGYRYGRWYYGHGHQHGCERHGNGGRTGRTYRD